MSLESRLICELNISCSESRWPYDVEPLQLSDHGLNSAHCMDMCQHFRVLLSCAGTDFAMDCVFV
jgi:hypothetical protein